MSGKIVEKEELSNLSFEESLKQLEKIVEELDSGAMDLEKAIEAYEIGTKLKKHCEKKLKEAQERIEKIEVDEDGELNINPIDIKE